MIRRWDPTRKTAILAEFEARQARLNSTAAGNPEGILIGDIESHDTTRHGGKIVLRRRTQRFSMSRPRPTRVTGAAVEGNECVDEVPRPPKMTMHWTSALRCGSTVAQKPLKGSNEAMKGPMAH